MQHMTDEQRLQALAAYEPNDHLIKIKPKGGGPEKDYYPANWRLFELQLRYPEATFESEVLYFDIDKNACLVRARLYIGASWEQATKRAEAHKTGSFTQLDKVETAAQARAMRQFGIGVVLALDIEEEVSYTLGSIKQDCLRQQLAANTTQWAAFKLDVLGADIPDKELDAHHLALLHSRTERR